MLSLGKPVTAGLVNSYACRVLVGVTSSCGFYKFDMKKREVEGEEIIRAELRLLQKATLQTNHYDVNIYYILRERDLESPLKLTFKHIDATPGWKTFDITPIAQGWKQGWVNHGIQIKLSAGDHHLSCSGVFYKGEDEKDTEPLLVVFIHDNDSKFLEGLLKESKHSTTTQLPQRHRRQLIKVSHKSCQNESFFVHPTALSKGHMNLVYPNIPFDIGKCTGHCTRVQIKETAAATNHARMVLAQYIYSGEQAEKRCCVPLEYEPITMLFYNNKSKEYMWSTYKTAKVTKCGCL